MSFPRVMPFNTLQDSCLAGLHNCIMFVISDINSPLGGQMCPRQILKVASKLCPEQISALIEGCAVFYSASL